MGSDFIKTCELCGEDFACRSRNARYCPKCREEIKRVDALNRYYIKRGVDKRVELNIKPTPKASTGKKWVWTNKKTVCPHNNCPFKSGKRPCLFYFEYKDGTATCPGARFVNAKGGIKNELAKGSN